MLDPAERRAAVAEQTARLMQAEGGAVNLPEALLDEVTTLVEAPTALLGRFAKDQLRLPPEVLISVMKKHQRYFPVQTADGQAAAVLHRRPQRRRPAPGRGGGWQRTGHPRPLCRCRLLHSTKT